MGQKYPIFKNITSALNLTSLIKYFSNSCEYNKYISESKTTSSKNLEIFISAENRKSQNAKKITGHFFNVSRHPE